MSKVIFKEGIKLLKHLRSAKMPLKEMSIYLETPDGEIIDIDIEFDEDGELQRSFIAFANEKDYVEYLRNDDELVNEEDSLLLNEVPLLN